ncbi:MAG: class B sortase [Christensenellales bacterium]
MNKRGLKRYLILFALLISIAGVAVSGYKILSIRTAYRDAEGEYADLRNLAAPGAPDETSKPAPTPETISEIPAMNAAAAAKLRTPADIARVASAAQTEVDAPLPRIAMDFEPLYEINEDTVAWITIDDTRIDYPVVQGEDNDVYLNRMFSGKSGFAGSIFMDYDNSPDFSDAHTVIFGHHLKDGSMFAGLTKFRDQAYFDEHPVMILHTPEGDYTVELFAAYVRDASAIPHDFDTDEDFLGYVDEIRGRSNIKSDVVIEAGDRILTLCTCSYAYDDARYVVHGKLVPIYD